MPTLKVALGAFARRGIESQLGSDLAAAVQAALCHYSGRLESGRHPAPPPRFLADQRADSAPKEMLNLSIGPEIEASLQREANRCGVGIDQIATHGVLVYLAELDFLSASSQPV